MASFRSDFDPTKSRRLRADPARGFGFEEAREIFDYPYYLDRRSEVTEQYRAVGWVAAQLCTLIFEVREDEVGEYYHFVSVWKATREERKLYEEAT